MTSEEKALVARRLLEGPSQTVHVLHGGRTACRTVSGTPDTWPKGHTWLALADWPNNPDMLARLTEANGTLCPDCEKLVNRCQQALDDEARRAGEAAFDPELHVTAGELRALGAEIKEQIPDVAWVPRTALRYGDPKVELGEGEQITIEVPTEVRSPFSWVTLEVKLGE